MFKQVKLIKRALRQSACPDQSEESVVQASETDKKSPSPVGLSDRSQESVADPEEKTASLKVSQNTHPKSQSRSDSDESLSGVSDMDLEMPKVNIAVEEQDETPEEKDEEEELEEDASSVGMKKKLLEKIGTLEGEPEGV